MCNNLILIVILFPVYTSVVLNTSKRIITETLCHNTDKLCCHFNLTIRNDAAIKPTENYYRYRLVVYSGVRTFSGVYNGGVEVCGIISCLNDTLESCAYR